MIGWLGRNLARSPGVSTFGVILALIWVFLLALAVILSPRLSSDGRRRFWIGLGPGLLLLGISILLPDWALFLGGAGVGWMVVAQFVLRSRVRMEYQAAVRHLRRSEYDQAIAVMDSVIAAEPEVPDHYRFRAEIFRLAGRLDRALGEYKRVISLDAASAAGYTGLAEVYAQQGDYGQAHQYARLALERDPGGWMVAYNLGMIEDRLADSAGAVTHLEQALAAGMPQSRYRLLARLWLARGYCRLGQREAAQAQLEQMRTQAAGLGEWALIFESEQAGPLRSLLQPDVQLARRLLDGTESLDTLV